MSDRLTAWLAEQEETPPQRFWGGQDCILFLADWVRARTGRDPAADLRGRYSTEAGARRVIARAGGLEALLDDRAATIGWGRTRRPLRGQVGLILAETASANGLRRVEKTGAICLGGGWWLSRLPDGGLIAGLVRPLASWGPRPRSRQQEVRDCPPPSPMSPLPSPGGSPEPSMAV